MSKFGNDIKNRRIDDIVNLLTFDVEEILEKAQNDSYKYILDVSDINNIVYKLFTHEKAEQIANNLYDLSITDDVPEFIEIILDAYKKYLNKKKSKVDIPINYVVSSIKYLQDVQQQMTEDFEQKENTLNRLTDELENVKKSIADLDEKIDASKNDLQTINNALGEKITTSETLTKQLEDKITASEKSTEELEEKIKSSENVTKKLEEKIIGSKDSIILLTVTVLGIFSSLTFSLSGSLSILNNMFSTGDSFAESLFKYSLIGMFIANLIFLLIYTVSKINNKSIAMHCSKGGTSYICSNCEIRDGAKEVDFKFKKACHGCEHKNTSCSECNYKHKGPLCKIINKFSYIFIINVICLLTLLVSFILGITGYHNFVFTDKNIETTTNVHEESLPIEYNANIKSYKEYQHYNETSQKTEIADSADQQQIQLEK